MNNMIGLLFVKPHTWDHLYKELIKVANNWLLVLSTSSKVCQLHSLHIVHIKFMIYKYNITFHSQWVCKL